jgi:hypothetical protein
VTELLDNKLRSLRNSSIDSDKEDAKETTTPTSSNTPATTSSANPRYSVISKMAHLQHPRPLTMGENIPFADESPERPLIQARVKPIRQSISGEKKESLDQKNCSKLSLDSSDTDSSTTSNYRERMRSVIRLEDSVLRKVNRILTNLEHLERKYSLNRSLSLNYKSHRSNAAAANNNSECCCANKGDKTRLSLTKDEKTDKNINKRRQLHDTTNTASNLQATGGGSKYRRHSNGSNRSIRRRHTVGGVHDYPIIKPSDTDRASFITQIT